jgi:hypothetical protein
MHEWTPRASICSTPSGTKKMWCWLFCKYTPSEFLTKAEVHDVARSVARQMLPLPSHAVALFLSCRRCPHFLSCRSLPLPLMPTEVELKLVALDLSRWRRWMHGGAEVVLVLLDLSRWRWWRLGRVQSQRWCCLPELSCSRTGGARSVAVVLVVARWSSNHSGGAAYPSFALLDAFAAPWPPLPCPTYSV